MFRRAASHRDGKARDLAEFFIQHTSIFVDQRFHTRKKFIRDFDLNVLKNNFRFELALTERLVRGISVRPRQAAGAEFCAAEISGDNDKDVGEVVPFDGREDRFAGGAGRLAVIVEPRRRAVGPHPQRPAVMRGGVKFLADSVEERRDQFAVGQRDRVRDES